MEIQLENDTKNTLLKLTDIVAMMNNAWRSCGEEGELILKSDSITVTETEVQMKFATTITLTVKKDRVDLGSLDAVSPAVSQGDSNK